MRGSAPVFDALAGLFPCFGCSDSTFFAGLAPCFTGLGVQLFLALPSRFPAQVDRLDDDVDDGDNADPLGERHGRGHRAGSRWRAAHDLLDNI